MPDLSPTGSHPRSIVTSLIDKLFSYILGFPRETNTYTTTPQHIPVGSNTSRFTLSADLLQPHGTTVLGTILMRSPYGRGFPITLTPRAYAARGYQVLLVSSRGTFGSGGDFDAFRTEASDGKAVVEWMRSQPWYTGSFAMVGGSYLGFVQWAVMRDGVPSDLVCVAPAVSPHDFARSSWQTGAMDMDIVRWAANVAVQEKRSLLRRVVLREGDVEPLLRRVPLKESLRKFLGDGSLWLDEILGRPDVADEHYTPMKMYPALEKVNVPVLIGTAWHDLFNEQSMEQYVRLKERGVNVALTVGPWTHMASGFASQLNRQSFDWIEEHLAGKVAAKRSSTVEYFVTGSKEWKTLTSYPPPTTPIAFFLQPDGNLSSNASSSSSSSRFTFDPHNPTPTMGGNGLTMAGSVDDTALSLRSDVLSFTTAPLEHDLEFCGRVAVHLAHSSDIPFADLFVRVSEVNTKGKSHNICEAYQRLDPDRDQAAHIKLLLSHHAHRFVKSTKIRVLIAGGNFPQYTRNHGVENRDNNAVEMVSVEHTLYHSEARASKVVFPVIPL